MEANGLVSPPEVGVAVTEHRSQPRWSGQSRHASAIRDRDFTLLKFVPEAGGIATMLGNIVHGPATGASAW